MWILCITNDMTGQKITLGTLIQKKFKIKICIEKFVKLTSVIQKFYSCKKQYYLSEQFEEIIKRLSCKI